MEESLKHARGSGRKKAPPGFYTAKQAQERLGLAKTSFYYYVRTGAIKTIKPPLRKEGYYVKDEIDLLADEMTLLFLQHAKEKQLKPTEFRVATSEDAQGIFNVITSLGWPATPAELRKSWYKVNPHIDHVVVQNGLIVGYINLVPYTSEALEAMMSGRKRGWDIRASDILPFLPGQSYDVFVGIATRDVPFRQRYGYRLLSGIIRILEEWASQGIVIRHMYATSNEQEGIDLLEDLGFVHEEAKEGDLFGRFVLDVKLSDSPFAKRYQEVLQKTTKFNC